MGFPHPNGWSDPALALPTQCQEMKKDGLIRLLEGFQESGETTGALCARYCDWMKE